MENAMNLFVWIIQRISLSLLLGLATTALPLKCLHASHLPEDKQLQDVKIKMSMENVSLEQAFQLIEQQTDFRFFYIKEEMPLGEKIKINQQERSLYQILQSFAKKFGLAFSRINNQIVVKKADPVQPRTYKVSGIIRDGSTHEPLVFTSIVVKGTQQGISTDAKGKFLLNLPQGNDTLRCSYVGYKSMEIPIFVDKDIQLSINLFAMDVLLQDVTIYAYQGGDKELADASALSLQSEKIKSSTFIFQDVLRSVQMLPGVSTNNEFNAQFNVRGGNPDENLVLVNGTQVYEPYHFKETGSYSIGVLNAELINKMDLMTGGFPARYGDKMSSVLNIEYREGNRERYQGTASLSLTDFDVVAEGPLSENGSFILGARKSYLEYLLNIVSTKRAISPSYYDVQGVVDYSLSSSHKLLIKFINAGDKFVEDPVDHDYGPYQWTDSLKNTYKNGNSNGAQMQYYSTLLALQSVNIISSSTILKTEISFYDQRENEKFWNNSYSNYLGVAPGNTDFYFNNWTNEHIYHNDLRIQTLELNSTLDQQLSSCYGIKTGASFQHITYEEDQVYQRTTDQFINYYYHPHPDTTTIHQIDNPLDELNNQMHTQSFKLAGYLENVVQLNDRLLLNVGGRFDYFDLNKDLTWSPRINLAYQVGGGLTVRGAWGEYYQSPNYRQVAYPAASDTNTQSQRAIHYVLGADYTANLDPEERSFLKMKVECFYKKYDNLMSATLTSYGIVDYSRKNDAVGNSKGADVYIMYSVPGFYGWVSYSYLEAMQDVLNDNYGSFPRNTDQQHTLAIMGDLDLGSNWNIVMRYIYGSGYPYTPLYAHYISADYGWEWISGAPNSERLPSYSCMDLRISKGFQMFGLATSLFLEASNLFDASNFIAYQYYFDYGNAIKEGEKLPPLVPSMGMSIRF
jgi:outer membrane receptor for ferrienterochelin and colicin